MPKQIEIEQVDGVEVVRLSGRLDAKSVEDLKAEMKGLNNQAVALDLTKVNFVDSSALGLIVSVFRRIQESGGKFCLFGLSAQVSAIFELTRLHRIFDIYADQAQALGALGS